ncbi:unnamed protein product, partial [Ascophyllum nodosum]
NYFASGEKGNRQLLETTIYHGYRVRCLHLFRCPGENPPGYHDELPFLQGGGLELYDTALPRQHIHTAWRPGRSLQPDRRRRPHRLDRRGRVQENRPRHGHDTRFRQHVLCIPRDEAKQRRREGFYRPGTTW